MCGYVLLKSIDSLELRCELRAKVLNLPLIFFDFAFMSFLSLSWNFIVQFPTKTCFKLLDSGFKLTIFSLKKCIVTFGFTQLLLYCESLCVVLRLDLLFECFVFLLQSIVLVTQISLLRIWLCVSFVFFFEQQQFFLVLGCLASKLIDLVLVESLLLLEFFDTVLGISQRKGHFLQFEIFHIWLSMHLSKFLLDSLDHLLHLLLAL